MILINLSQWIIHIVQVGIVLLLANRLFFTEKTGAKGYLSRHQSHPRRLSSRTLRSSQYTRSSSSSISEDSILAAVSTLFQQAEEDDDEPESSITARILPKDAIEYERRKPNDRRLDANILRQILEEKEPLVESSKEEEKGHTEPTAKDEESSSLHDSPNCVALDVDVTLNSPSHASVRHRIQMHLHREANESSIRSLQRLELSLQRRLKQQENLLRDEDHHQQPRHVHPRKPSQKTIDANKNDTHVTVLVQEEAADYLDEDDDGYKTLPLHEDTSSSSFWEDVSHYESSKLCLNVKGCDVPIMLAISACPPTILSVQTFEDFCADVFVGVPLVIETRVLHAAHAMITWFADQVEVCRDSKVYTPRPDDVGKTLSVLIIPMRPGHAGQGCEEAYQFANAVEELPNMPLIRPLRQAWVNGQQDKKQNLRVMSYNLLADLYTSREVDREQMYNHCPAEFLNRRRRMPMLLYELLIFQPDIICLQEVDRMVFAGLLRPCLESQGYQGYYSNKASAQLEGCAMFWSLGTFRRASNFDQHEYNLKDLFQERHGHRFMDRWDSMDDIDRLLEDNPELSRVTREKVGQVLQVAELHFRCAESGSRPERIVVGNSHLFYHPLADHIRAMQAYMVCRQLDTVRRQNGKPCPLIFCGDLNSDPLSGTVQLLVQRNVGPEHHETWKHLHEYEWGMGDQEFLLEHGYIGNDVNCGDPTYIDEAFEDALEELEDEKDSSLPGSSPPPQIHLPTCFPTLVSGYTKMPEFTNYAIDFAETLDYVLVSTASPTEHFGLKPIREASLPSVAFMKKYVAMPNEFMPSDHVSLICDLAWECYGQ